MYSFTIIMEQHANCPKCDVDPDNSRMCLKAAPKINTKIKDIPVTCDNPGTHMGSHTKAAGLQYVELYSSLVILVVVHANETE